MTKTFSLLFSAALMFAMTGCSDEAQMETAVDNYGEEVAEANEEMGAAMADGMTDADELEEVEEERDDVLEAAGEVAEQRGDLIEEQTD